MSLDMNAAQPCGTDARRRTHWAYGELCVECMPEDEWTARCPTCLSKVTARGGLLIRHKVDSLWPHGARAVECPGTGERVEVPAPRRRSLPEVTRARGVA